MSSAAPVEQLVKTSAMWSKWGLVGTAVIAAFGIKVYINESHHEEHHVEKKYTHQKIRTKPFPWSAHDCDVFDLKCKREAREASRG